MVVVAGAKVEVAPIVVAVGPAVRVALTDAVGVEVAPAMWTSKLRLVPGEKTNVSLAVPSGPLGPATRTLKTSPVIPEIPLARSP